VLGATGQQGFAVANAALDQGYRVRAFVRDASAARASNLVEKGAVAFVGNFDDSGSLGAACEGAEALFLALPAEEGVETERRRARAAFGVAASHGIQHIVYSSAASSNREIPVPHVTGKHAIERELSQMSSLSWNVVAPVYFMENNLSGFAIDQLRSGKVTRLLSPECKVQQVALADVAAMVLHLIENRHSLAGRRVEVAGDSISSVDIARTLERRLERTLTVEQLPSSVLPDGSEFLASVKALLRWLEQDGFSVEIDVLRRDYPGVPWTDFETWVSQQPWNDLLRPKSP